MRRLVWISGALVAGILALVALAYLLVPRDRLSTSIAEQVSAWTGRDVILSGEPDIDLLPSPTVTLTDVTIGGPASMPDAGILTVRRLVGEVRLLPLLIGEVEIGAFTLVEPHIRLLRAESGERNWDFDTGAAALQLAFAGDVPLGRFEVIDGTVEFENREDGIVEEFAGVNALVDWESVRTPLQLRGEALWRGELVRIDARAEDPFGFINRRTTPVRADIRSTLFDIAIAGEASGVNDPRLAGELDVDMPSLRSFLRWTGSPIGEGETLGPARITGQAEFAAGTLSVTDARIRLDDNNASGALSLALVRKVPLLSGTLAFDGLDLAPYLPDIRAGMAPGGDWRAVRFDTDWFDALDSDIRLSAARIDTGTLPLGRTAATVSLAVGRLELGIAEAELYDGSLSGAVTVAASDTGDAVGIEAELRASAVDLAAIGLSLGTDGLEGTADAAADLSTEGVTLGDLVAALAGRATLEIADGTMPGMGLVRVVNAVRAGDPALLGVPAKPLSYSRLDARLRLANGLAGVEAAHVLAPDFEAELSGAVGLPGGRLDLQGILDLQEVPSAVPFTIGGTIAEPRPVLAPIAN